MVRRRGSPVSWGAWPLVCGLLCAVDTDPAAAQQNRSYDTSAAATALAPPLVPGDAIRLSSWIEAELKGEYPVDETGTVTLPMLGTWRVGAVPADSLKQRLAHAYAEQLNNSDLQITLLRRVLVFGAVRNPGAYLVDPTMTLADAIALAGGATREGKLKNIQIVREGKLVRSDLAGAASIPKEVRSGDQITIPERSWFSRNGQFVIGGAISAVAIILSQAVH